ncbi:MAG: cytochrome P450, partial [Gammaproteobacteria bacterium]|nr:cytochrome P450 [Gammaproteobacteria bacterium]
MTKQPYQPVVPAQPDDINFLDHEMQNCPYHAYQLLRDEAPVWIDPVTGFYVITRFEDLREVLLDKERFSNDMRGGQGGSREQLDAERAGRMYQLYEDKGWVPGATLAGRDDPNHKQMRTMFDEAFKPKRIRTMDPFVRDTAYKLIDEFIDDGQCDWVK